MKKYFDKEHQWVLIFSLFFLLILSIPYILGYFSQTANLKFSGFIFGVEDGNSYIAKMLSGANGAWLFKSPYTPFEQNGFLAFFPYILLGKLTSAPGLHEQLVSIFHIYRILGGMLCCLAIYDFISLFLKEEKSRRIALLLIVAGGGVGWIGVFGLKFQGYNGLPLEFYSPEAFGFLSFLGIPHLLVARALLLWGMTAYFKNSNHTYLSGLKNGLFWFILGFFQPLTIVIGWAILGIFLLVKNILLSIRNKIQFFRIAKQDIAYYLGVITSSSVFVLYTVISFEIDPFLNGWQAQNIILSPPPIDFLLAYGLMLIIGFWGLKNYIKIDSEKATFLIVWIVFGLLFAYFPYNLQRRLTEGVWVVIVVSALLLYDNKKAIRKRFLFVIVPSLLSSLILFVGGMGVVFDQQTPVFNFENNIQLFQKIDAEEKYPVVLASHASGNVIPAYAAVRVVVGHGPESIQADVLEPAVEKFFQSGIDENWRVEFIKKYHIRYVFWSDEERKLGDWNPLQSKLFEKIYQSGDSYLLRVDQMVIGDDG